MYQQNAHSKYMICISTVKHKRYIDIRLFKQWLYKITMMNYNI